MAAPETMADLAAETPWDLVETLDATDGEGPGDAGGDDVGVLRKRA